MKQVILNKYGTIDVLEIIDAKIPKPVTDEVLIKVSSIGVNYADIMRRENTYVAPTPLPYVLGFEVVGYVEAIGKGTVGCKLKKGDKVLALLPEGGGYSEYVTTSSANCIVLPQVINDNEATAIFAQGSTAYLLMHSVADCIKGKTVLIHAASGGVGSLLVQLGKMAGAKVIAAAGSDAKLEIAKGLGADILVNYRNDNWVEDLISLNNGEYVDYIFEMVGGRVHEQCMHALKPGGSLITYGTASGEKGVVDSKYLVKNNQQVIGFNLGFYVENRTAIWQKAMKAVIGLIAEGKLKINVEHIYALTDIKKAHADIENRLTVGKVVLRA